MSLSDKPIKLISFHRKRGKIILVSSAKSDSIFVLDMDSFNVVCIIENSVSTSFLSWSPDQNHFIIGSVDGKISCYGYDVNSIKQVWECSLESNYLNVALSYTCIENESNILRLWRIDQSCKLLYHRVAISNNSLVIQSEPQEFENVRGCSFLFDSTTNGTMIICGSSNGSMSCFKLNSNGAVDLTMKQNVHSSTIVALKLSPDCSRLGSLGSDGLLCVVNTSDQTVTESIESVSYAMDHLVVRCSRLGDNRSLLREEVTSVSNDHEHNCLRSPSSDDFCDDQILRVLEKVFVGFDCNGSSYFEVDAKKDICTQINDLCCSLTTKRVMIENHLKSYDSRNQCCSQIVDVYESYICNDADKVLTDDLLRVSSDEILGQYHAMTKMHKEKCKVLKFRNEIEHELENARWRIELLKREEINLKEIIIDIKVLSKRSQKLNNEKSLEVKISRHKQALENIQNEQRKLLKIIGLKEKDNHGLMKQIDELGHIIVFLEKENMNDEERKKHPDLFMKQLMTKHKLKSSVKAQEMEIKKLMKHLQKLREKSFPTFSHVSD
jgi:WD40 repeat protein